MNDCNDSSNPPNNFSFSLRSRQYPTTLSSAKILTVTKMCLRPFWLIQYWPYHDTWYMDIILTGKKFLTYEAHPYEILTTFQPITSLPSKIFSELLVAHVSIKIIFLWFVKIRIFLCYICLGFSYEKDLVCKASYRVTPSEFPTVGDLRRA